MGYGQQMGYAQPQAGYPQGYQQPGGYGNMGGGTNVTINI
jgi:hypothetical protein